MLPRLARETDRNGMRPVAFGVNWGEKARKDRRGIHEGQGLEVFVSTIYATCTLPSCYASENRFMLFLIAWDIKTQWLRQLFTLMFQMNKERAPLIPSLMPLEIPFNRVGVRQVLDKTE
jgi:hypothetical protein